MPSIQDSSDIATFLNEILESNDYYWVGPYEPQEIFFVKKGRLPGKYISLLTQFRESDYIRQTFIKDFEKHPPKVIIFKLGAGIFGTPSDKFGKFFLDWMKDKYTQLENIKGIKIYKNLTGLKLDKHLYFLNKDKEKILKMLRTKGYIEKIS